MKKNKKENEHEVLDFGHGPVGPSPCRVSDSAELVLYIRLANNSRVTKNKRSVQRVGKMLTRIKATTEMQKLRNAKPIKTKIVTFGKKYLQIQQVKFNQT